MTQKKDHFEGKAEHYEKNVKRVNNVKNIADGILKKFDFNKDMHIVDFGSGTGLLTQEIAPYVGKITAVDMSQSMNEVLASKKETFPCELEIIQTDLTKQIFDIKVNAIISSMTMHHVEDLVNIFETFFNLLDKDGIIALADLETEDGTFHSEDTGVFHFGFDPEEFLQIAKSVGFTDLQTTRVSVASKPYGDFPIFLLTGRKA